jgi:hypothetical protein
MWAQKNLEFTKISIKFYMKNILKTLFAYKNVSKIYIEWYLYEIHDSIKNKIM